MCELRSALREDARVYGDTRDVSSNCSAFNGGCVAACEALSTMSLPYYDAALLTAVLPIAAG
jgi:hypothetical protein